MDIFIPKDSALVLWTQYLCSISY